MIFYIKSHKNMSSVPTIPELAAIVLERGGISKGNEIPDNKDKKRFNKN